MRSRISEDRMFTDFVVDCLQEDRTLGGGTLRRIEVLFDEVVHRILEVSIHRGIHQWSVLLTLNLVYAFGLQSKASRSVYPPRPGRPGSPAGFGIFESSERLAAEVDKSLSDSESKESEEMGVRERERSRQTIFG